MERHRLRSLKMKRSRSRGRANASFAMQKTFISFVFLIEHCVFFIIFQKFRIAGFHWKYAKGSKFHQLDMKRLGSRGNSDALLSMQNKLISINLQVEHCVSCFSYDCHTRSVEADFCNMTEYTKPKTLLWQLDAVTGPMEVNSRRLSARCC